MSSIIQIERKYVSIATIYNEWFGLGTSAIIIPDGIYSLQIMCPEWRRINKSALKKKLSRL